MGRDTSYHDKELPLPGEAPSLSYMPGLDGLRGVAALSVIWFHVTLTAGWYGVDLFFVLSGYLITTILIKARDRRRPLKSFYARRFLRIVPLYVVVVALVSVSQLDEGGTGYRLAMWSFTTNIYTAWSGSWHLPEHLWSIAMEEQFYLVWPLLVLKLSHRRLTLLAVVLIAVSVVGRWVSFVVGMSPTTIYTLPVLRLDTLAAGALISCIEHTDISALMRARVPAQLLLLVCAIVVPIGTNGNATMDRGWFWPCLGYSVVTVWAVAALVTVRVTPVMQSILENRLVRGIGRVSYGMYMWGALVQMAVLPILRAKSVSESSQFVVSAIVTFGVAMASWYILERPILRLKRYFPLRGTEPVSTSEGT